MQSFGDTSLLTAAEDQYIIIDNKLSRVLHVQHVKSDLGVLYTMYAFGA